MCSVWKRSIRLWSYLIVNSWPVSNLASDWLNTIPNASTESLLSDNCHRISTGLRSSLELCPPHPCRCVQTINKYTLHLLSCRLNSGRFPRRSSINDVTKRFLQTVGFPSILEPVGLNRDDGTTLFIFERCRCLIWDATCTDTFVPSNILSLTAHPGSAVENGKSINIALCLTVIVYNLSLLNYPKCLVLNIRCFSNTSVS